MGKTQSFIHLKPATISSGMATGRKALAANLNGSKSTAAGGSATGASRVAMTSHMLRVHLNKFPSLIGHATSRINRLYNEDTYSINILKLPSASAELSLLNSKRSIANKMKLWEELPLHRNLLNISIFDGHGGDRVSKMLASELHEHLVKMVPLKQEFESVLKQYKTLVGGKYWTNIYKNRKQYYDKYIKHCNTKVEQVLLTDGVPPPSGSRMIFDKWGNIIDKTSLLNEHERLRLYSTYLKYDLNEICGFASDLEQEAAMKEYYGGSTASSIFLTAYDEQESSDESFFVAPQGLLKLAVTQIGDTKIILCDKNGIAHSLSKVHHPSSSRESRRLGGHFQSDSFGDTRFLNNFANTRSFGDRIGKRDGLTCEPDIYSYLIGPTRMLPHAEKSKLQFGGDECFICLVSDGVTTLMSDQEICDLVTSTVNNRGLKTASPQYCAQEVLQYIMAIGSKDADNATCIVLRLPNWGNWPVIDRTGAIREEKLLSGVSGGDRSTA
ncbi:protein phosphatase 2C -like protein 6 [Kluyveromyces marxianus]|uniref:Protein phosphatase 2C homolog 6 n=2 Tax=Kluyveromyces marxianus TaxID=4911 RepID=W0T9U3_KLUMD|nr:uncharacterized protein KLMA_20396 [Kluyveromyces marxianus DMKU3-1042]QGN14591.1 protein phosphatase 2C -like protein 6 [Kluyveromyces marxianus]BAO38854.1 protein phosphatase 2C homolog 6 [Kluyveromyces marxianus DMKU3-1042]